MGCGKVYVASSLDNKQRVGCIIADLRSNNVDITYDWTTHGRVYDHSLLADIAILEENGVRQCDVFFMVLPGGGGTHFEFGVAKTLGKPIVILEETDNIEQKSFYFLPNLRKFVDYNQARTEILNILGCL